LTITLSLQQQVVEKRKAFTVGKKSEKKLIKMNFILTPDYIQVETALQFLHYLDKESELVVWTTVLNNLRQTLTLFQGSADVYLPAFKVHFIAAVLRLECN